MAHGSQGSFERTPGALFRAMGALYLQKTDRSREALARELQEHLETLDVRYHVRTLKRQLTGSVATVPPETHEAMRHVLVRTNGARTDADIEADLRKYGLWVAPENRQPEYVSTKRIIPLGQLWLLLNPTHSQRALATTVSGRLARQGVGLKVDPLQNILAGRQPLARREVHEVLLELLSVDGIASEGAALARWKLRQKDIAAYVEDRTLEPATRLANLATAWKLRNHQPSSRRLSVTLQGKLRQHGVDLCLLHIQKAVDGKFKLVRRALVVEMECLLQESLPEGRDLATEVVAAAEKPIQQLDLCWVVTEPIATLAKAWLDQHPGTTMRQLSIRVAKSARRLGYRTSQHSIQPILSGHKHKTRGFIYRAMLKQLPGERCGIPLEHIVRTRWAKSVLARMAGFAPATVSNRDAPESSSVTVSASPRSTVSIRVPGMEEEVELARRIEDSENKLLCALLRSAVAGRRLSELAAGLDEGTLFAWDIVVGAAPKDQGARRDARDKLHVVFTEVLTLEAQCALRRSELLSRARISEKRTAQLHQELEALWRRMASALADTRFSGEHLKSMGDELAALATAAAELVGTTDRRANPQVRRIENEAGLTLGELKRTSEQVRAAARHATQAKNELIKANQRLVGFMARKFQGRGLELADLIQEGNIGLARAVEKFDYRRGFRFVTYANWWIRSGLQRAVAGQGRTIRVPDHLTPLKLKMLMDAGNLPSVISLDAPIGDGGTTVEDFVADREGVSPLEAAMSKELADSVEKVLSLLDPREANVLARRYGLATGNDQTLAEVAKVLGISRERVRQIEASALKRLGKPHMAQMLNSFRELPSRPQTPTRNEP